VSRVQQKTRHARFQVERQAREILGQRAKERDKTLRAEHREIYGEVLAAADLLSLFRRRPDLAEEFDELAAGTEHDYGDLLFRLSLMDARLDGEVVT